MSGSLGKSSNQSQANNQFQNQMNQQSVGSGIDQSSNVANQNVFGPQSGALDNLYSQAGNLFGNTGGKGGQQQNQFGAGFSQDALNNSLSGQNDQLAGGAYGGMDLQGQLTDSLNQSANNPSAMQDINSQIMGGSGNNYADVMRGQYVQDADLASQNMLRNLDARATGSGMSGGARQGVATRGGFEDINRNLQRNLAQTGFGAFDKDLDRKLQIAQQADQNTFGRQQLLSDMIGGQNQAQTGGMNFGGDLAGYGNQQQMMPFQQLDSFGNAIGGPTVLDSSAGNQFGMNNQFSQGNSQGSGTGQQFGSGKGFGISGGG